MDCVINTYGGGTFDLLAPLQRDVQIVDIAHALSLICRFNGHCRTFYSVAEHSLAVSEYLDANPTLALLGLLHDAPEAYMGDVVKPLKRRVRIEDRLHGRSIEVGEIEMSIMQAVARKYGLADELICGRLPVQVEEADDVALATEALDLMPPFVTKAWSPMPDPRPRRIQGALWPEAAKMAFLDRFHLLMARREQYLRDREDARAQDAQERGKDAPQEDENDEAGG